MLPTKKKRREQWKCFKTVPSKVFFGTNRFVAMNGTINLRRCVVLNSTCLISLTKLCFKNHTNTNFNWVVATVLQYAVGSIGREREREKSATTMENLKNIYSLLANIKPQFKAIKLICNMHHSKTNQIVHCLQIFAKLWKTINFWCPAIS